LWERSLKLMSRKFIAEGFFYLLIHSFLYDTEQTARGYLDMNEQYCASSLSEIAYDREGKPLAGPPTEAQQKARENPVELEAAKDLVALQERLKDTRKVMLGLVEKGEVYYLPNGQRARQRLPVYFDPSGPPPRDLLELPGDPSAHRWETIKAGYDQAVQAIRMIVSLHPKLYLLMRENPEDTSKIAAVADDKSPRQSNTLGLIATELAGTIKNITAVRPMLGKALAEELVPIHQQLLAGVVTSPTNPDRNWATDPVWKAAADAYVEYNKPPPWWQTLGLTTLEIGVFIIAGLATGGIGFAVAMAAKGALEAGMAIGKSQVMSAASLSNVSEETQLVGARQAEEARTDAAIAAAFAVLDALMVGVELRAVGAAAKLARLPGAQAAKSIELSERVLRYEKKLLGQVSAEGAEQAANEAKALGAQARRAADEAKAESGAGASGRARMADKAAQKAEDAVKRIEKLADAARRAEQAKAGIPASEIAKAFELPLPDGGKIVVSTAGKVFICASPCSELLERFADVIARNPALSARATAFKTAEAEAIAALPSVTNQTSKTAIKARMATLASTFRKECERFRQAEGVVEWLKSEAPKYPGLTGKNLDAAAIARVLEKGPAVNGMKGQLLEEISNVSVEGMLTTSSGRGRLAGQFAGEDLVFIPGHRLRDSQGRQLTDGLVGFWKGDTFQIVTVIESKAGLWAAEGLRFGEAELGAVRSARHRLIVAAYRRRDPAAAKAIRDLDFATFVRTNRAEVDRALKEAADDSDWAKHAIEDVQEVMARDLRAAERTQEAADLEKLGTSAFAAKYPEKAKEAAELIPLPEAGQFTRDLERTEQVGGKIVDTGELPQIVDAGKVSEAWKMGKVPAGVGRPTQFAGGRGSVRARGFATSDVDTAKLVGDIRSAEGVPADVTGLGLSSTDMEKLATDIGVQAKAAKTK
jgi:hypothetical protein